MTLLITGGAGFIGSAVVRHLIQHTGDSVVNVDKLTYAGNLESLTRVAASERYAFEQVDTNRCRFTARASRFATGSTWKTTPERSITLLRTAR